MKKILKALPIAVALCVPLAACGTEAEPRVTVNQGGASVFPVSTYEGTMPIYMGDVMPFYDGEVMNIYHLQNSRGSLMDFYHPIARITTTDYVNYKDEGVAINFEESITSPDAALGTGSFIKDSSGKYHCFYTGHNADSDSGLQATECVRHAVSNDQKTWTKVNDFMLFGNDTKAWLNNDFRDPYVYYDTVDTCYYMLVTTRADISGERGIIKRYKATSLDATAAEWEDKGVFYVNDNGTYNMECPSYIEYNGFYYLAFSEQGANRVTHYCYKTTRDGEWQKFDRDSLDSTGFYAGRLEKAGDKLYGFAWCATLTGGSTGEFDWGGNLVTHEIRQDATTGELFAVMTQNAKNKFKTDVKLKNADGNAFGTLAFDGKSFKAYGSEALCNGVTRIHFTVNIEQKGGDFGIALGMEGAYNNRLSRSVIAFESEAGRIAYYNDVVNILRYGAPLTTVGCEFETGKTYNVDMLVESGVVTVYFDDTVALTARSEKFAGLNVAFYSNGAKVSVKDIAFYE